MGLVSFVSCVNHRNINSDRIHRKRKSVLQKGLLGLQLTLLGSLIVIGIQLGDSASTVWNHPIGQAIGYILVGLGSILSIWASIFSEDINHTKSEK